MTLSRARGLLIGRLQQRKQREREGLFLAEGVRCAATLLQGDVAVRFAVTSPGLERTAGGVALGAALAARVIERVQIDDAELSRIAATESPQGVLLVCEQPTRTLASLPLHVGSRVLVLDAVQDPGNAGTLVRVAAAFALDAVVLLDGSVDPWSAKAVRASAGTVGAIHMVAATIAELRQRLAACRLPLYVAAAGGEDIASIRADTGWALVVGNEGAGVRSELLQEAARRVAIPMPGDIDSLNVAVAGALALYALTRPAGCESPAGR